LSKILLRSGYFDNFLALGENGQSIFDSALQIRETLRLRKQFLLADCLAIPQSYDSGEKVDWYAPYAGNVIPWASADEKQRRQALSYLDNCLSIAAQLSERSLASPKNAEQLFGSLLQHALRFPGCHHVYLIDEKPVLTFWGFIDIDTPAVQHPLACLQESKKQEAEPVAIQTKQPLISPELTIKDEILNDPESTIVTLSPPEVPVPLPSVAPPLPAEPLPAPQRSVWRKILWPILNITFFIVLLLAWPWLYPLIYPPVKEAETVSTPVMNPAIVSRPSVSPVLLTTLPLRKAEVVQQKIEEPKPEASPPKNALVLPAEAVKAGTTKFLDGNWRVIFTSSDTVMDIPTGMRLQIKNDIGQARITQADNFICRAEMHFGLMQSGNLVIKPRSRTECFHGSHRHTVPEIMCSQGLTGAAQCNARYEDNILVPVTFIREGK
jgi:hypothetical protein